MVVLGGEVVSDQRGIPVHQGCPGGAFPTCLIAYSMLRAQGSEISVQCPVFRVQCSVFKVQSSELRVQCLVFKVQSLWLLRVTLLARADTSLGWC